MHWRLTKPGQLRVAVVAGLIAGLALSPKLWLSGRSFPLTPVWRAIGPLPAPWDVVVFGALLGLLLCVVVMPGRKAIAWAALGLMLLLALQDQSRWQPWFYQYFFMLAALSLADGRAPEAAFGTCRFIVASIYFWSGVAKFNLIFKTDTFPWLIAPITKAQWMAQLWFLAPIVECAIGLGLLSRRFRMPAMVGAIAMHVLILGSLGPLGHNTNSVVWPWNVAMVCFLLILFRRTDEPAREILWVRASPLHVLVLVLFGVAPALSLFNRWDHYLSSELYSGKRTSGVIYLSDAAFDRLPDDIEDHVTEGAPDRNELDITDWSVEELNVPAYPEIRIYKNAARRICSYVPGDASVQLTIHTKPALVNGNRIMNYRCADLQ